jgi:putative ABC transport system permease protein
MDTLRTDLLQARRALARRPAYFFTCAATFALVLAANAAIFAVVNATLLLPMPFRAGDRVMPGLSGAHQRNPLQQMDYLLVRERARTMTRVEGYLPAERVVIENGEPAVVKTAYVTSGLMDMMGAGAVRGRLIEAADAEPGREIAVLSHRYWERSFGGEDVLGRTLTIDGVAHVIAGVAAPGFPPSFIDADVFSVLVPSAAVLGRNPSRSVVTFAELADGATPAQAHEETRELVRQIAADHPATHDGWTGGAQTARQWQYGNTRAPVLVLFGATGLVLLIACINVAALTSAQSAARARDTALRLALGASRAALLRVQVAELAIVALAGALPGLLLARAAVPALLALDPVAARALGPVSIDWRVQLFTLALALAAALAAAIVPALHAARGHAAPGVASGGTRTAGSAPARRTRRLLIAGETALCLALLMAGAVLVDGLRSTGRVHPGFNASNVLTAQVRLPQTSYPTTEARAAVVARMLEQVRAIPGVTAAGTSMNDFTPGRAYQTMFHVEGRPTPNGQPHATLFNRATPGFFEALGVRVIAGRTFTEQDHGTAPSVAVVSRLFAEELFPGEDAVGRTIRRTAANSPSTTIIGVVDDMRDLGLTQAPERTLYLVWPQNNTNVVPVSFAIRTAGDPLVVAGAVRAAIQSVDASLPLRRVQTLEAFLDDTVAPVRFRTTLLAIIAVLGLTLAALGVYGVAHRAVLERAREFAVRLALGARPGGIVKIVVTEAMKDVAIGAAIGVIAGIALCAGLARVMTDVGSASVVSSASALAILAAVATVATLVPAARILRLDASDALRM